jgi:hypothetical protein
MSRKPKYGYAYCEEDGRWYVRGELTGISPLVLAIDALPFRLETRTGIAWYDLELVASWHERESSYPESDPRHAEAAKKLRAELARLLAGGAPGPKTTKRG